MISSFVSVIEDTKSLSLSEEKERSPQHKTLNPPLMVAIFYWLIFKLVDLCFLGLNLWLNQIYSECLNTERLKSELC